MSDTTPRPSAGAPQPLIERVQARVTEVGLALDRPSRRPRRQRPPTLASAAPATPDAEREARSLRQVFLELGDAHRRHRQLTGQHASPALRDAAWAFKKAPSLTSLAVVAGFLDEDGLLGW
jgi:hypothetical protein